ncbi:PilW family protein [Stutzerimonas tarimensis]|uniref:PilW family protein n=1 Tax=Stutzerimonas tarimensis TaxID=1507735 RepID=A0ABV7T0B7_9GAMM
MTPRYHQHGVSLTSLLVGLVVSMIVILSSMALFNNTLQSNTRSSQDARLTGERATGLLVAHMELQGAGFGIDNAQPGTHLRLISGATLTGAPPTNGALSGTPQNIGSGQRTGNALIWSQAPNLSTGQVTCTGLYAPATGDLGLYLLRSQPCSDATEDLTWDAQPLITDGENQPFRKVQEFTFTVRHQDCQGLGVAGQGHLEVTLNTKHSTGATKADSDAIDLSSTTCLLNFPQ